MKYFKLFESFINESAEATSMWQDESTMIDDCKKFLMSNLPFKYSDVIHPKHGYGSLSDDFDKRGLVSLKVIPDHDLYYEFSRYIKSEGFFDLDYKARRREYIKMGGGQLRFIFFSGSNAINRGIIIFLAGGINYNVGNYSDPSGFSGIMKKILPGIKSSDNEEQFEQFMSDLNIPTFSDRTVQNWYKEWNKK